MRCYSQGAGGGCEKEEEFGGGLNLAKTDFLMPRGHKKGPHLAKGTGQNPKDTTNELYTTQTRSKTTRGLVPRGVPSSGGGNRPASAAMAT